MPSFKRNASDTTFNQIGCQTISITYKMFRKILSQIKETTITNDRFLVRCLIQRFNLSSSNSWLWRSFDMFLGILEFPQGVGKLMPIGMTVKIWRRQNYQMTCKEPSPWRFTITFLFVNFLQLLPIWDYITTYSKLT